MHPPSPGHSPISDPTTQGASLSCLSQICRAQTTQQFCFLSTNVIQEASQWQCGLSHQRRSPSPPLLKAWAGMYVCMYVCVHVHACFPSSCLQIPCKGAVSENAGWVTRVLWVFSSKPKQTCACVHTKRGFSLSQLKSTMCLLQMQFRTWRRWKGHSWAQNPPKGICYLESTGLKCGSQWAPHAPRSPLQPGLNQSDTLCQGERAWN